MRFANLKKEQRRRRHARIRAKVSGAADCPRLSVFKSNKALYVQLIDDTSGKTLAASSGSDAAAVGKGLAEKAKALGIPAVVFDRGGFVYTGKVKILAEALREGGLKF